MSRPLSTSEANSDAVKLIQRFGSAAKLNIHLHCLVLDGVYRRSAEDAPEFVEAQSLESIAGKLPVANDGRWPRAPVPGRA